MEFLKFSYLAASMPDYWELSFKTSMLSLHNRTICCQIFCQVGDGITGYLELSRRERETGGRLGPYAYGMINIVGGETAFFNLIHGEIAGQLMDDRGYDFQMGQLFCTQRSSGNVLLTVFWDGHGTVGFSIHSFSTFERIKKYDENEDAGNVGKPYSIEVRDTERTITIYGIASTRFDIAG